MRIACITDTHFGARNDSRDFLDYFNRFYNEIFFPEIERRGIKTIIHLGDIVDRRKYINYVTMRALRETFVDRAYSMGIDTHVIIGNHDIPYRNTNDINAMREMFSKYDKLHLYWKPKEVDFDDCKILMMPWINQSNYDSSLQLMKDTKAQIMFGHLEIKGFEMYRGMPCHEGFESGIFDKFDIVASGHFHHKTTLNNINYLGAPYEITWSDYDDPRGFHIFDTETRSFEYIINPLHMFHKIWYDDKDKSIEEIVSKDFSKFKSSYIKVIIVNKTNSYWFDIWLGKLHEASPLEITIVEDHENMDMMSDHDIMNSAEDTRTILSRYVENLEVAVNKNMLDKLMKTLYDEAMEIDMDIEKV